MKTAREKGLEDVGEERGVEEGGGGGVVVGEGEVEERGGEGEGELPAGRNEEEREGQTSPHSPPTRELLLYTMSNHQFSRPGILVSLI